MKIVINERYGGFSLSGEGLKRYYKLKGIPLPDYGSGREIKRTNPDLIQVVEELGEGANGAFAGLVVRDIPAGAQYRIAEYDGYETLELRDEIDWDIAT